MTDPPADRDFKAYAFIKFTAILKSLKSFIFNERMNARPSTCSFLKIFNMHHHVFRISFPINFAIILFLFFGGLMEINW